MRPEVEIQEMPESCPHCGRRVAEHEWHFRSIWPERVAQSLDRFDASSFWGNDELLQVPGLGSYVRMLVRVDLVGLPSMTYRVWLEVFPEELERAWSVWETPAYQQLELRGILANRLKGWPVEVLDQTVEASVLSGEEIPVAKRSDNEPLGRILRERWEPAELGICRFAKEGR